METKRVTIAPDRVGAKAVEMSIRLPKDHCPLNAAIRDFSATIGLAAFGIAHDVSPGDDIPYAQFTLGTGLMFRAYLSEHAGE